MKDRYEKYLEDRKTYFREVLPLGRRGFMQAAGMAAAAALASGKVLPHSFQPVEVVHAALPEKSFRFAYISDSHLYEKSLNERFVRAILKAVDDVNALDPQPDFILYGGDLAQLGQPKELEEGAQILKALKAPVRMMVGEHDWYLDMGDAWRKHFGKDVYSFDHKGVHFVVLNSVIVEDYWTAPKLTAMERMLAMAQLDNPNGRPFTVGAEQRDWLKNDLAKVKPDTPVVVFSHSPLYKIYKAWNFWTDDAEEVQKLLAPFKSVTVIHGHTHQMLTNRIGNIHFHGMLSTAWPWPYAPQGLPRLTVRMNRADPFDELDGCGDGTADVLASGRVDKHYNLWSRNPIRVSAGYLDSDGAVDRPPRETDVNY
ncbi:MAG TPA: metallophosphoesterase [Vicinamibacteria bacterium]|nr:metallophosphoesterase [Vicinamibacteria bacterium]